MNLGRNEPCHCGSGRKYKKCCLAADEDREASLRKATAAIGKKESFAAEQAFASLAARVESGDEAALEAAAQEMAGLFSPDGPLGDVRFDPDRFADSVESAMHRTHVQSDDTETNRERLFQAVKKGLVTREFLREVRARLNDVLVDSQSSPEEREGAALGLTASEDGTIGQVIFEIQLDELLGANGSGEPIVRDELTSQALLTIADSLGVPVRKSVELVLSETPPPLFTVDELLLVSAILQSMRESIEEAELRDVENREELQGRLEARVTEYMRKRADSIHKEEALISAARSRLLRDATSSTDPDQSSHVRMIASAMEVAGGLLLLASAHSPDHVVARRRDTEQEELARAGFDDPENVGELPVLLEICRSYFERHPEPSAIANLTRAAELLAAGK